MLKFGWIIILAFVIAMPASQVLSVPLADVSISNAKFSVQDRFGENKSLPLDKER
jgi:hypothetical protein